MSRKLQPIYSGKADVLAGLDQRLQVVHAGLLGSEEPGEPLEHTAGYRDWQISLESSPEGALLAVSMVRCGVETYSFERTEDTGWAAVNCNVLFPGTFFYNLVHMATQEGLEWASKPAAVN